MHVTYTQALQLYSRILSWRKKFVHGLVKRCSWIDSATIFLNTDYTNEDTRALSVNLDHVLIEKVTFDIVSELTERFQSVVYYKSNNIISRYEILQKNNSEICPKSQGEKAVPKDGLR